jgi:5-methyltetrahydrofolate--homocysteine methyltransferase
MDGATGTQLQKQGMPLGACTEEWALAHSEILLEVQRAYVDAGSAVLVAPTMGANESWLSRYGQAEHMEEYNRRLVALTRQAAGGKALVAGDLGPTGLPAQLRSEGSFESLVRVYTRQAAVLARSGVDLYLVECMTAMAEMRAAVLGIRAVAPDKAILVTCCCDGEGRTPTGTDVLAAAIVMQGMGVAAFGLNCVEPVVVEEQLARLHLYVDLPLIALPSAGLPVMMDGQPVYRDAVGEFSARVSKWAEAGVRIFGGCCGTHPGYIAALREAMGRVQFEQLPPVCRDPDVIPCASEKEARFITPDVDVGETIPCTPDLLEDILVAEEESPVGALRISILKQDDLDFFAEYQFAIRDALCIWSDVPELMERALRLYQGRAFYDGTAELEPKILRGLSDRYGLIVL